MSSTVDHVTLTSRLFSGSSVTSIPTVSPSAAARLAASSASTESSSSAMVMALVSWMPALTPAGRVSNPRAVVSSSSSTASSAAVNVNMRTVSPAAKVTEAGTPESSDAETRGPRVTASGTTTVRSGSRSRTTDATPLPPSGTTWVAERNDTRTATTPSATGWPASAAAAIPSVSRIGAVPGV